MRKSVALVLDFSAISLSGLCLVHCLLLPVIVAILPIAGVLADTEWIHKAFVLMALPISGFLIFRGECTRGRSLFLVLAISGLALLVSGAFLETFHAQETVLTVVGASLLACAHLWRWTRHSHFASGGAKNGTE